MAETRMSEETNGDLSLGLSPEEKADLEELIVASRSDSAKQLTDKQVLLEMDVLKGRVGHLAGRLLELDKRLDRLFEIVRLSHEKSELLCRRIEEAFPVPEKRGVQE
jgi:hypothetical protein